MELDIIIMINFQPVIIIGCELKFSENFQLNSQDKVHHFRAETEHCVGQKGRKKRSNNYDKSQVV